jgi:hypothetical protein
MLDNARQLGSRPAVQHRAQPSTRLFAAVTYFTDPWIPRTFRGRRRGTYPLLAYLDNGDALGWGLGRHPAAGNATPGTQRPACAPDVPPTSQATKKARRCTRGELGWWWCAARDSNPEPLP